MAMATAQARARHGSYLFQRAGSSNWYVKLRSPGKRVEVSLGTSDKLAAEHKAGPLVTAHKAALLAARPRVEQTWRPALEPGRLHAAPDGGQILATEKELHYIGHNGAVIRTEPNGGTAFQLVGGPLNVHTLAEAFIAADFGSGSAKRPTCATKSGDDTYLETYLKHANVTGDKEREARDMWALYKTLTDNKPLKNATRDDGRLLVAHLRGDDPEHPKVKAATVKKKIGWLSAAVNLAIKEKKLEFNPFSGLVSKKTLADDSDHRKPLSDADIVTCKAKIDALDDAGRPVLDDADRLLFRLLAATGMREGEAYQINGEETEEGVRFVVVGSKTDASLRRVPLPADVLPFLRDPIKGPLFAADTANRFADATIKRLANRASKRLMSFLRNDCGILDADKVVHSTRHRAQDRLRRAACPKPIRQELLGHDTVTIGEGYGEGHPVPMLKEWIDKIGF
jgi:integrase